MKFLVLGGCADMAMPLLKRLHEDDAVSGVMLADLDEAKAKRLAEAYGGKFTGIFCDATDAPCVVSLMRGYDVAVCYVGPFYRFERALAACAIEAAFTMCLSPMIMTPISMLLRWTRPRARLASRSLAASAIRPV